MRIMLSDGRAKRVIPSYFRIPRKKCRVCECIRDCDSKHIFVLILVKLCTEIHRLQISIEFFNKEYRCKLLKMAVILDIYKKRFCLERIIIFESESHLIESGKTKIYFNIHCTYSNKMAVTQIL